MNQRFEQLPKKLHAVSALGIVVSSGVGLVLAGPDREADVADARRVTGREDVGEVLVSQLRVAPDQDALFGIA
jgi:hypothetical protein